MISVGRCRKKRDIMMSMEEREGADAEDPCKDGGKPERSIRVELDQPLRFPITSNWLSITMREWGKLRNGSLAQFASDHHPPGWAAKACLWVVPENPYLLRRRKIPPRARIDKRDVLGSGTPTVMAPLLSSIAHS